MFKILCIPIILLIPSVLFAQISPKKDSKLNYRLIGFTFPSKPKTDKYTVQVATGTFNNEKDFRKHVSISWSAKENKIIGEVPEFGTSYTWRVVYTRSSKEADGELYHFSTMAIPALDTNKLRVRIVKSATKYNDAYLFIDATRGMYDMNGKPVWFMPPIKGISEDSLSEIRDIKLSPEGTLTFLLGTKAYEINYDGTILWQTPKEARVSGDSIERFHHEFTRLTNGHYMTMGKNYVNWYLPQPLDSLFFHRSGMDQNENVLWDTAKQQLYMKMEFGTVIEYDKDGNVVWSWKCSNYFKQPDPKYGIRNMMKYFDTHENSCYFDEKNKFVYVGFRNLSEILKIKYPEGTVENEYKNISKEGSRSMDAFLFCYQHACKRDDDGYLYLFNNNLCLVGAAPRVILMQEPQPGGSSLHKLWEYECPIFGATPGKMIQFIAGGNVTELPDHSFYVAQYGDSYCNLFIVSRDKQLLWAAVPEKWNETNKKWEGIDMYRSSIITDSEQINQLLWHQNN